MMVELNSRYSKNEELANALSHLIGVFLAIAALVLLVVKAARIGNGWHIVSSAIFGATMIILFLSSTMTHWLQQSKAKEVFFTIDQIAIFTLIAGTYTPFTLVALHGPFGWVIFGLEWGLALIGITIKLVRPIQFNQGVNLFYILLLSTGPFQIPPPRLAPPGHRRRRLPLFHKICGSLLRRNQECLGNRVSGNGR